jgi:hypothetical protein
MKGYQRVRWFAGDPKSWVARAEYRDKTEAQQDAAERRGMGERVRVVRGATMRPDWWTVWVRDIR